MKMNTIVGNLWFDADEKGVTKVSFTPIEESENANQEILHLAKEQFSEYFAEKREAFTVPLSIQTGTAFQQDVWQALIAIPYGESRSYKEIAQAIGNPKSVRAIGQANRVNPLPIIVPCHRVIGQNGQLTGYMGKKEEALQIKKILLELEGVKVNHKNH
ncbi:methylated-DNA--[protein]-cysteine S-methyltransferase [Enterococcus sp. DIV0660C]|uniref:methylated-DNA--[protein]-cysteine S-methyltransferase n=1 Tax=Enterococcus sp. DIV0660C TaxID=2230880 RepID=UPI001A8F914A|nr:methylated-DNA--[protein]-cysteine S-methyltransferase [Enterococcus sp. DIV0660C]MBO0430805.1 methylated-DNA--[protein]-cysteine S-methyltransferase [Enterococcus sp. DIV0660C]